MKYHVRTTDGETVEIVCDRIKTSPTWVEFFNVGDSCPETVSLLHGDQIVSILAVEE
jgi:hypothetical protein